MALLKMPYEIQTNNIRYKILIYGQPGIGKTTFALSMPSPVLIDADNGFHRIDPRHRVPTLPVSNYGEVLALLESNELAPFQTIVIDTAGKLLDYINAYIVADNPRLAQRDGSLQMKGWGARAATFSAMLKKIGTMNKHVVFVAHEKEDRDGDTKVSRPDFGGGKSGADLMKDLDLVGYMEAQGRVRTASFAPHERYYAKNSARIADTLQIPDISKGGENNFLTGIISQCEAAAQDESEQRKAYDHLIADLTAKIGAISDPASANAVMSEMASASHIWDSKMRMWKALTAKAQDIGIDYIADQKTFVAKSAESVA